MIDKCTFCFLHLGSGENVLHKLLGGVFKKCMLLCALVVVWLNGFSQADTETGNNSCGDLFTDLIVLDAPNNATLSVNSDVDFFRINVPAGGVLKATITPAAPGFAFSVQIWNSNCTSISSVSGAISQPANNWAVVCSGIYYIRVARQSGTAPIGYSVVATMDNLCDTECNNTMATATPLPFSCSDGLNTTFQTRLWGHHSGIAAGTDFNIGEDQDFYQLQTCDSSGLLNISVTAIPNAITLYITCFEGTPTENTAIGTLTRESCTTGNLNGAFILEANKNYFLRFFDETNQSGSCGNTYNTDIGCFNVSMQFEASGCEANSEPNNTYQSATPIYTACPTALDTTFSARLWGLNNTLAANTGNLSLTQDQDFYRIETCERGGLLNAEITNIPNSITLRITCYEVIDGSLVAIHTIQRSSCNSGDIHTANNASHIPFLLDADKTYYLRIYDETNEASSCGGDYNLDANCFTVRLWFDADFCEPNNTFDTACEIPVNTTFQAKIWGWNSQLTLGQAAGFHHSEDQDYYRIDVIQSGVLTINVSDATSTMRYVVRIYNELEELVNTYTPTNHGDPISDMRTLLCVGTYYIRITEHYTSSCCGNHTIYNLSSAPYSISLAFETSDDHCECNNTFDTACPISLNTSFQAKLTGENRVITDGEPSGFHLWEDQDFYSVVVPHCGVLDIAITNAASNMRYVITVYNAHQQIISSKTADEHGISITNFRVLLDQGTYYIRITEHYNSSCCGNNTVYNLSNVPYTITLSFDDSDPCECNNTFATACEKAVVDTFDFKINGVNQLMHYTPNDRDFFKFCPDNCGIVNFKVIGIPQGFSLKARVYTDTTAIVSPWLNPSPATGLNNLQFSFSVVTGQCYYVMLSHNNDTQTNSQAMTAQVGFVPSIASPVVSASGSTNLCPGQCVTLTTNSTVDHHWTTGATTQSIQVCEAGIYRDTIYDALGCFGVSNAITVMIQPPTNALFLANSDGATVQFTNQSSGSGVMIYLWEFGDGSSSEEVSPSYTYNAPGTYTVTLTVDGPCGQDTYTFDVTVDFVGIEESENPSFSVYPNPSSGVFTVETTQQGTCDYRIYNVHGGLVLEGIIASKRFEMDISHLPQGLYVLKIGDIEKVLNKTNR